MEVVHETRADKVVGRKASDFLNPVTKFYNAMKEKLHDKFLIHTLENIESRTPCVNRIRIISM